MDRPGYRHLLETARGLDELRQAPTLLFIPVRRLVGSIVVAMAGAGGERGVCGVGEAQEDTRTLEWREITWLAGTEGCGEPARGYRKRWGMLGRVAEP